MIGEEVRRRREELGLTGAQLAGRAGLAPSAVSQIETGRRTPSSASVVKLAEGLGVEVGELYPKKAQPRLLEFLTVGGQPAPTFDPADLPEEARAQLNERGYSDAYFVPLEEGEEEEKVELQIYYVRLFEGGEPILKAMRKASPAEAAQIHEELTEKAGRGPA